MADDARAASIVLGTAGHIDHGKTALVRALTGTDTDRLKEEKERGITIELGFAELDREGGPHCGVVDVPGHEAFVRAMVAGAAGMDVVLLVVAADEGVMPQTREHLAIVELLGVPELVVALTKCDTVDTEWLDLVEAEVEELLEGTRYAGAPSVRTAALEGVGVDDLLEALAEAARRVDAADRADLARLPLDRVFTIQGTGTVVTGTLWSGELEVGDRVRLLPGELEGRVRGLQVHGRETDRARAGDRTAVALTGEAGDREQVTRGTTLVRSREWTETWMLTARVEVLPDSTWLIEHNQRLHVHLGTSEVLARCVLLEAEALAPGDRGWVQLRLETPLVARADDRFVVRAYSPVTTIGGGVVAEPTPPKRNRLAPETRTLLEAVLDGDPEETVRACLGLAGWSGAPRGALPILSGLGPREVEGVMPRMVEAGAIEAGGTVFASDVRREAEEAVLDAVEAGHAEDSLRPVVPMAFVRSAIPSWAPSVLADAVITALVESGSLEGAEGGVRRPGFRPEPSEDQEAASSELLSLLAREGLAPPLVDELPEGLRARRDFWPLLRRLEALGRLRQVADGMYVVSEELDRAAERIRSELGGRSGLGPADFREVLPVTRKHLIPLLNYFDGHGTTRKEGEGRSVPRAGA